MSETQKQFVAKKGLAVGTNPSSSAIDENKNATLGTGTFTGAVTAPTLTASSIATLGTAADIIVNGGSGLLKTQTAGTFIANNDIRVGTVQINKGGTGQTTALDSIKTLLDGLAGQNTGYVLKTNGSGSYFWESPTVGQNFGTNISVTRTITVSTTGQTVFTSPTYVVGSNQLKVFVNGVRQYYGAYTETSTTSITFSVPISADNVVLCEVDGAIDYSVSAGDVPFTPSGNISATNVQSALVELDSEKEPLITQLAVNKGGTGANDASGARTNLGLGTISTQASSSVTITGGSITNITDITLADGGTNASLTAVNGGVVYSSASAMAITATGTSGDILKSNGAGAPTWVSQSTIAAGTASSASSATYATNLTITNDTTTSATYYPVFSTASTGNVGQKVSSTKLTFNPNTGMLTATGITGPLTGNASTATKSTNLIGGNNSTLLGSIPYQSNTDTTTLLSPNTTITKKFLSQTGTGSNGAIPVWNSLSLVDLPQGTAYQILAMNSGSTSPEWITPDMTYIPGASYKASAECATTEALTLNTAQTTIDGVTIAAATRVLIKNQATASQNGIYYNVTTTNWTRVTDADSSTEIAAAVISIDTGTVNGGKLFTTTFKSTDTLGTTAMNWYEVSTNQTSGSSIVGSVQYNGTTASAGMFDGGTTTPTGTTRLNYGGYFYPTYINLTGSPDTATAATHYFVETASDGYVRPKTLANVKTEIVTTAAVNAAAATTVGTVTTGTWSATAIDANKGGTGQTTYAIGDLLYAPTTSTVGKLADVATGNALISGGVGVAPSYGKIGLTTHVTGTLGTGNGGTGSTATAYCSLTANVSGTLPVANGGTGATTLNALAKEASTQTIWVPAGAMVPQTTNGAAPGTVELTTNDVMIKSMDFDAATQQYAHFAIRMPKGWNEGTITWQPVWSHPATTSFGVVFGLQGSALSDGDAQDVAWVSSAFSTDTGGTTDVVYIGPVSAALTIGGTPAAQDYVVFRVHINVVNASDTMPVDARLQGITIFYTTTSLNDA